MNQPPSLPPSLPENVGDPHVRFDAGMIPQLRESAWKACRAPASDT